MVVGTACWYDVVRAAAEWRIETASFLVGAVGECLVVGTAAEIAGGAGWSAAELPKTFGSQNT